jgi:hypothetical protein
MNITPTSIECQLGNACLSAKGDVEYHAIDAPTPQALLAAIEKCWHQYRKNWPRQKINLALAVHGQVDAGTGYHRPCRRPLEATRGDEISAGRKTQCPRNGRQRLRHAGAGGKMAK